MNIETRALADGRLHHTAFAVLPKSGRVAVDLHRLDAPGWAEQSAAWFKDDAKDVTALFDAAVVATTFAPALEAHPVFEDRPLPFEIARRKAYPPIGDQLDMLFRAIKAGDANFSEFVEAIEAAKARVPKP